MISGIGSYSAGLSTCRSQMRKRENPSAVITKLFGNIEALRY
jgi:hypothetical protein